MPALILALPVAQVHSILITSNAAAAAAAPEHDDHHKAFCSGIDLIGRMNRLFDQPVPVVIVRGAPAKAAAAATEVREAGNDTVADAAGDVEESSPSIDLVGRMNRLFDEPHGISLPIAKASVAKPRPPSTTAPS